MFLGKKVVVLLPAAGSGSRMGYKENKQFLPILDKAIISHTVSSVLRFFSNFADEHVGLGIICAPNEIAKMRAKLLEDFSEELVNNTLFVAGGSSRRASVRNGILAIKKQYPDENPLLFIHDAARCLLSDRLWLDLYSLAVESKKGICPGLKSIDTLRMAKDYGEDAEELIDRNTVFQVQTPQVARLKDFHTAHELLEEKIISGKISEAEITDDISILQLASFPCLMAKGERQNLKMTSPEDIAFAEFYLNASKNK